jgi:type I restriction enzyme S subunit
MEITAIKSNVGMKWEMVKIPDVLFYMEGPGVRNTQFTTSGVKLLNVGNINNGLLDLDTTTKFISEEEAYGKYKHFLVEDGDLLIASSGIVVDNFHNKITWATAQDLPLCMNTSTIRFKTLDSNILNIRYFSYFLKTKLFTDQLRKLITGSAQLNFGPSHLKQIYLPLPPLATQKRIAEILDAADALRRKDQALLQKYDELAQAIFMDMFGDPVKNEKGWEVKYFGELFDTRLGKMLDAKKQIGNSKYRYLGNSNVQWFRFQLEDLAEMEFDEKDLGTFSLKNGDILICEGGEVGRSAIWRNEKENIYFQKAIHRARPKSHNITSEYTVMLFWFYAKFGGLKDFVTTSTISHLTGEKLKTIPIPVPPISLQMNYDNLILSQKKLMNQTSSNLSESLFQTLLQKAFNGELVP